ncbi:Crp/Fnr family transcriptional regulator [Kineococcus sp. NUM-3379]
MDEEQRGTPPGERAGDRGGDVVRRAPLFAALDDEAAAELLSSMETVHLDRGQVLFSEGEPGHRVYVIREGKIKLGRSAPDGRENLLAIMGPGEMFGELSLFDPGPRTSSARAVAETELLALSHDEMLEWLARRPEVARHLLQALAQRLRRTNVALADLVFTDVPGRVAKALLDLSRRFGRPIGDGVLVAHDLTQEELAQLVGASRETVNKALADFASRGWLRLEARAVVLHDVERLTRRAR